MQVTIMYKFTAQFSTDVTALRLGEKLERRRRSRSEARRVLRLRCSYGRVAAALRLRCVSFDFSANARDRTERKAGGTERRRNVTRTERFQIF